MLKLGLFVSVGTKSLKLGVNWGCCAQISSWLIYVNPSPKFVEDNILFQRIKCRP